jgi:hypothetical protein
MRRTVFVTTLFGILLSILVLHDPLFATTYYGAPNGSGTSCTIESPCTLNTGLGKLSAGDTLYLRGGTYRQTVSFSRSGISGSRITISGYPGEIAIIDGQYTLPSSNWGDLCSVTGNYVTITNLTVQNSNGIGVALRGTYDQAINIKSYTHRETGIIITGDYGIADGCEVYGCANRNARPGGPYGSGGWASGLSAARSPLYATIRNCKSWNNWGEGISTFEADYTTIEENIAWDNWACNYYLSDTRHTAMQRNISYWTTPMTGGAQVGIMLGDEKLFNSTDNKIINNLVKGGNRCLYSWLSGTGLKNFTIAYNTFVNANAGSEATVSILSASHSGSIFKNNIIEQHDAIPVIVIEGSTDGIVFSNNNWSKTPSYGSGTGDVIGNPLLAKTGPTSAGSLKADYFKILADSPARDKAKVLTEVTEDFFKTMRGTQPDMGGHEYTDGDNRPPDPPTGLTIRSN